MNLPVFDQLKASWLLLVSALQSLAGGSESVVSFEWQLPLLLLLLPLPLLVYLFLRHRKKDVAALLLPGDLYLPCLLYTSPSPRDRTRSRMPSSA